MHWYPRYVPVDARRVRTVLEMHDLRARGVNVQPIEVRGRTIARSFWGRRWCAHLESFTDYESRLPCGRPYVRNGSVCHLDIQSGGVDALVVGSALHHVVVRIGTLEQPTWKAIRSACAGRIGSVRELLEGRLSDHVADVATSHDGGLFPAPAEIELACDCPDQTTMCAHAAAVLYGVGSRLDDSPELLFYLRGVDAAELIVADRGLPRGMATADARADRHLGEILGVDFDAADGAPATAARKPPPGTAPAPKGTLTHRPPAPPAPADSKGAGAPAPGSRPTGKLVARLRERTGFSVVEFAALLQVSAATVHRWEATPGPLILRAGAQGALTALHLEIGKQEG